MFNKYFLKVSLIPFSGAKELTDNSRAHHCVTEVRTEVQLEEHTDYRREEGHFRYYERHTHKIM